MRKIFTKQNNRGAVLLMAASLLLPLASCTDTATGEPDTDARAIAFTPAAETRAAVDGTTLPANSSFKVWGWYDTNKNVFNGNTVSNTSGAWTYDGGTQYWIKDMTYNFYGVYPADVTASVESNGTITVTNFDCSATGANAVDLMTATHTRDYDGTNADAVNMPFKHELARVNIIVISEGDAVKISNAKIYGINHMGTLNNNQWTVGAVSTEANPSFSGSLEIPSADINSYGLFGGDLLLIPASTEKLTNATLSFDYQYVNGTSKSAKIELQRDRIQEWVAGSQYKYAVTIPRNAVDITVNVEILKWDERNYTVTW